MSDAAFPYRVDARGRTALSGQDAHIREMIEQLLFTTPGERVNRPDLGSGILELVFAGNDPTLAAAVQAMLHATIDQWLGDLVEVREVAARAVESTLEVEISWIVRRTGEAASGLFRRPLA
jgi:hypothetical protein